MRAAIFVFLLMSLFSTQNAQAKIGAFIGTQIGFGKVWLADGFYSHVGGQHSAGSQDILANTTVYRDVSQNLNTVFLGLNAGVRLGAFAPDVRARVFLSLSHSAKRFTRGASTNITSEEGDFSYLLFTTELGLRFYPFSFVYLRPYLGYASALHSFSFDSYGSKRDNFREKDKTPLVGGAFMFELGKLFPVEIGVDYSQYRSKFGGVSYQAMIVLGSALSIGI